jgi:hypothetical protein
MFFKGKKVSNALSVFTHYKRLTGRSFEKDFIKIGKDQDGTDNIELVNDMYYAFRCAGECKELDVEEVSAELTIQDVMTKEFSELFKKLLEPGKSTVSVKTKKK